MQWYTQAGNITTDLKVKVDFGLPALSAMDVVTWKFHVDKLNKSRYDVILENDQLIELGLNLKFSNHIIEADGGPLKGCTRPMVDLSTYAFTI